MYFILLPIFLSIMLKNNLLFINLVIFLYFLGILVIYIYYPQIDLSKRTILNLPKDKKFIALTFDDGSTIDTLEILKILKKYNIKATFFLVGEKVLQHVDIAKKIIEDGHSVGNHTFSHDKLTLKSRKFIFDTFDQTQHAIKYYLNYESRLIRSPHGLKNFWIYSYLKKNDFKLVSWTRGVWDTDNPDTMQILSRATTNIKNGEILLFHDGRGKHNNPGFYSLKKSLPKIITTLKKNGFSLVKIEYFKKS